MKLRCGQRGCEFEADAMPDDCPVCNNPMIDGAVTSVVVEDSWEDWTVAELRDQATEWELEGWNSRTSKGDLIELLEAAEAEDGEGDDD